MDKNRVTCCCVVDATRTIEVDRTKLVPRASVYAIIRKGQHHVAMIRGALQGRLTLPGGGIEAKESFGDGLRREVWEETGLKVTSLKYWGELENFVYYEAEDTYWHVFLQIFVCEVEDLEVPLTSAYNPDNEGSPEWVDLRVVQSDDLQNIYATIVRRLKAQR